MKQIKRPGSLVKGGSLIFACKVVLVAASLKSASLAWITLRSTVRLWFRPISGAVQLHLWIHFKQCCHSAGFWYHVGVWPVGRVFANVFPLSPQGQLDLEFEFCFGRVPGSQMDWEWIKCSNYCQNTPNPSWACCIWMILCPLCPRGGLWLQGLAVTSRYLLGLWDQICVYGEDKWPSSRWNGHLQRLGESSLLVFLPVPLSLYRLVWLQYIVCCSTMW